MSPDVGTGRICHIIKIIGKERGFYGMTKEEAVIRSILGPVRSEIRTFACAVGITVHLLFDERMSQDDIRVTKHVYPEVAKRTGKSYASVSRKLERMGNLCWDNLGEEGRRTYIGRQLRDIRAPRDMLFYLAFYCHFNRPYYEVLEEMPELLFQGGEEQEGKLEYISERNI